MRTPRRHAVEDPRDVGPHRLSPAVGKWAVVAGTVIGRQRARAGCELGDRPRLDRQRAGAALAGVQPNALAFDHRDADAGRCERAAGEADTRSGRPGSQ